MYGMYEDFAFFFNGTNNHFFRQSIDLWGLFPFTCKELCIQHTQSTRLRPILMRVVRLIPPVHLADASFFFGGERRNGLYLIAEVY
jgi:hypothetical protein